MGWQMIPSGIGWKGFSKTLSEGQFECGNPRCKGRKATTQQYRLRQERNWFTVLFIPVIPLNVIGSYVQCGSCKSIFTTAVIAKETPPRHAPGSKATRATTEEASAAPAASTPTASPPAGPAPASVDPIPSPVSSATSTTSPAQPISTVPGVETSQSVVAVPPSVDDSPIAPEPALVREASGDRDGATIPRSALVEQPPASIASADGVRVRFTDGREHTVVGSLVVGRDPVVPPEFHTDDVLRVDDRTMTMSKTHARLLVDAGQLVVDDLGSANGVTVRGLDGVDVVVVGPTVARPGSMVSFGDVQMHVVAP